MSNVYHQINDAIVRALKTALPDMDVTSEHLAKTDYGSKSNITDYIYIGLTPVSRETVSAYHTRHSVVIDLAVHTAREDNAGYWALADTIDHSIRPVIRWGDRAITVPASTTRSSTGYCTAPLRCRISTAPMYRSSTRWPRRWRRILSHHKGG